MTEQSSDIDAIRRFLRDLNETWTHGDPRTVAAFFAEDAIIVHPGFGGRTVGREACVESYVGFRESVSDIELRQAVVDVDLLGAVAVASYAFTISYRFDDQTALDSGRDLYVLRRHGPEWQIVWRTLLLDPAAPE